MKIFKKLILTFSGVLIILFLFLALFHNFASADVTVNFGINNLHSWIQTRDSDLRIESQTPLTINVPGTPGGGQYCGTPAYSNSYVSLQGAGGTPGIVFSGENDYSFGAGLASIQTPPNNFGWVVGNANNYNSQLTRKTSYDFIYSKAKQGGLTPIDLTIPTICPNLQSCDLEQAISANNFPHGFYNANDDMRLTGSEIRFLGNQNFVILVNGDLTIATKIKVDVGSTAIFIVKGDITVDRAVGEDTPTSTNSDIEGMFSADKSFIIDGYNDCSGHGPDLRLNLAGNLVTGAGGAEGSFTNNRDLCDGNLLCPVFFVSSRPDFILNMPTLVRYTNYTWQEIAP